MNRFWYTLSSNVKNKVTQVQNINPINLPRLKIFFVVLLYSYIGRAYSTNAMSSDEIIMRMIPL